MSEKKCCVPDCGLENEILHKFPNPEKEPERFRAWIYNIGGSVLALDDDIIFKRRRVCHLHFEAQYHTRSKYLSAVAIPRLCLPGTKKENPSDLTACDKPATGEVRRDDEQECARPALCDAMLSSAASSADDDSAEPSAPPLLHLHTAQFEDNEGSNLGSLICWECAARLRAASTFRNKALLSDILLQRLINQAEQIENKYFETVKREADRRISPKTLTVTEIIHIVDIEDQNNTQQLVQSGDDDQPPVPENSETQESVDNENLHMKVEGNNNVAITTEIEDLSTFSNTEDENITEVKDENPQILPHICHTALRSDLTSSQEDFDEQIIKTFINSITKSRIVPKQNIELKNSAKITVSNNYRPYHLKEDTSSEDGNKKKKLKSYGGTSKKRNTQVF